MDIFSPHIVLFLSPFLFPVNSVASTFAVVFLSLSLPLFLSLSLFPGILCFFIRGCGSKIFAAAAVAAPGSPGPRADARGWNARRPETPRIDPERGDEEARGKRIEEAANFVRGHTTRVRKERRDNGRVFPLLQGQARAEGFLTFLVSLPGLKTINSQCLLH